MKTTIKTLALAIAMTLSASCVMADNDRPISKSQLPTAAQTFINTYFKSQDIALAKVETGVVSKSYDVIFTNGDKLEFDRNGNWTEVDCKRSSVPTKIIPTEILNYVKKNFGGQKIRQIEKKKRGGYEIELTNGLEIEFNKHFQVIDIDD